MWNVAKYMDAVVTGADTLLQQFKKETHEN